MGAAGKLWRIRTLNSRGQTRGSINIEATETRSGGGAQKRKGRSRAWSGEEEREAARGAQRPAGETVPRRRRFTRPGPALRGYPSWADLERLGAPPGARRRAWRCLWSPLGISGLGSRPSWFRRSLRLLATSGARPPKSRLLQISFSAQAHGLGGAAVLERQH